MSHSSTLPPVHDTSPPPFDDDVDENDSIPTILNNELASSISPDILNNSNNNDDDDDDDWKSVDNNNDTNMTQIQDDTAIINDEHVLTDVNPTNDDNDDWANFAEFENKTDEVLETPSPPPHPATTTSTIIEETIESDWADFESNTVPYSEQTVSPSNEQQTNEIVKQEEDDDDDDDDFGEFSEVQAAPQPQTSSLPTETLTTEQIESLVSTCFPLESATSSTDEQYFISTELPSFTTYKNPTKQISCLESSLSLWNVLSNLSNDPVGIKFQWRKSNSERLFHQALGVNERFRTKTVPLTPEILQPEKVKSNISTNNESENIDNENKLSTETIRPHFDWKQSGLQNPLADNDSSSLSSNISKNEENGFDANKSLDLDFYVPPPMKSFNEDEQIISSSSSLQRNDSPIIPQQQSTRTSIPIKTMDLYPGSTTTTTTLSDDAKHIIDTLPNLNFMSAKALMFPIRFNANNNDESTTLY